MHNPYHFVPANGKERPDDIKTEDFKAGKAPHLTHDCYVGKMDSGDQKPDLYSGRLICRMETEDPVFIGDKRIEGEPNHVLPFELDGRPAIPSSTLRGMISSLAEAASNSAMRVLEERHYSYRVDMGDAPGALGMIVAEEGADNETVLKLRPLALPVLQWRDDQARIPKKYSKIFSEPLLKVYVNGYEGRSQSIDSFLSRKDPDSYCADKREFWYMKLAGQCKLEGDAVQCAEPYTKREYLIGQRALGEPITEAEYDSSVPEDEKDDYTRGILRVLGIDGREKDIPSQKKHEIFIPYPPGMETSPTFDVQEAVEKFENLAKERTRVDENLPFHLKGSRRNNDPDPHNNNIKLRGGDIVFFDVSQDDLGKVGEVAISSIWRRSAGGTSYDYFREISPELLPFNPERKVITMAEQLFGFVEHSKKGEGNAPDGQREEKAALSLAGRLRFSFGMLEGHVEEPYESEVILKILDSPKPPCPPLYFKHKNSTVDRFIYKNSLKTNDHIPQGRKFYLHRYGGIDAPWETRYTEGEEARLKMKSCITPLKRGLTFYFHVDFHNLTRRELSLLCYALSPSDPYRHKIGMGKSIGLGKVQIVQEGLFIIDRIQRYLWDDDIFSASRYHRTWAKSGASDEWPEMYAREKKAAKLGGMDSLEALRKEFADSMDRDIRKAIELMGDPQNVRHGVHTPQLPDPDLNLEKETFRWFVENEKTGRYTLKPINEDSTELPRLGREFPVDER